MENAKESTVNQRLMWLINRLGYSEQEFCARTKLAPNTLKNIMKGTTPYPRTIRVICEAFNVNEDFIKRGEGPEFSIDPDLIDEAKKENISYITRNFPILKKTIEALQQQLKEKDEQISMLKALVKQLSKGELSFNEPSLHNGLARLLYLQPVREMKAAS